MTDAIFCVLFGLWCLLLVAWCVNRVLMWRCEKRIAALEVSIEEKKAHLLMLRQQMTAMREMRAKIMSRNREREWS